MSELLVVRHGQSTWNAEHRWAGWGDPPLSAEGRAAAAAFAETSAGLGVSSVVSSDLSRAAETAGIVAERLGLPAPALDLDLRERAAGSWTGRTTAEIDDEYPGWLERWRVGEMVDPPAPRTAASSRPGS